MLNITTKLTVNIASFFILGFLLFACTEQKQPNFKPLSYDEIFFDTELSSIWSDSTSNQLWIGGENGELYLVVDNLIKWRRELKSGRIYKVVPLKITPVDTTLLIGIRNEGLQLWKFSGDNKPEVKRYFIEYKGFRYSAYDFQNGSGNAYYVGTSNGCYYIDLDASNHQMKLVYPVLDTLKKYKYECSVYNLQKQNDGTFVGASPQGVFWLSNRYTPIDKRDSIIIPGKNTTFVSVCGDTLLALSENKIYKHCKGHTYPPLDCKNNPKVYFEDSGNNKWLIASRSIRIGRQLKDNFEDIELPKSIPLESQRNIIVRKADFSYLITQNSLWRIPIHLNIYTSPRITAICQNRQKQVFFVTSENQLFKKTTDNKAEFIKQIDTEGHIVWASVCESDLYFHTGTNMIYRTPISSSGKEKPILLAAQNQNSIITAYLYDNQNNKGKASKLLFGTRDGLFSIDIQLGKIDTLLNNKYTSAISHAKGTDYIVATTLNDGIFGARINKNKKSQNKKSQIDKNSLILDIVPIEQNEKLILTNHYIFYENGLNIDSIRAKAYKKLLLLNDTTFYAIGYKGFTEYSIKNGKLDAKSNKVQYQDISFTPNACIVLDDSSLLLGSKLGCLHYDVNKKSSSWVNLERPDFIIFLKTNLIIIMVAIAIVLLFILLIFALSIKKIRFNRTKNIIEKNNDKLNQNLEQLEKLPERDQTTKLIAEYKSIMQNYILNEWEEYIGKQEDQLSRNLKVIEKKNNFHKTLKKNNEKLNQNLEQLEKLPERDQTTKLISEYKSIMQSYILNEWEGYIGKQEDQLSRNDKAIERVKNELENRLDRQNNLQKRLDQAKELIGDLLYFQHNKKLTYKLNKIIERCDSTKNSADKELYYSTLNQADMALIEVSKQAILLFQNELSSQINTILNQKITILYDDVKQAEKALKEKNTSEIRKLTIKNIKWFTQSLKLRATYEKMLNSTIKCFEVPNVNHKLHTDLLNGINNINKEELESCQKECQGLTQRYNYIGSLEATRHINQFIEQTVRRLEAKPEKNYFYGIITQSLSKIEANKKDNITNLQSLNEIMIEVPAIEALCNLKQLMEEFSTLNHTQKKEEICKEINRSIDTFYEKLPKDFDEHLAKKMMINGATKSGKALALMMANRDVKGADVGRLLGDAKPENLEGRTSKTRKDIRSDSSREKNTEYSEKKNNNSTLIALLMNI